MSDIYKVHINDRDYTTWEYFDAIQFKSVSLDINPHTHKLLANDIFILVLSVCFLPNVPSPPSVRL